ncbi:cellulose synthase/poly-beta-1,6-N-acetylglucosamine synthase-like glycosyltransferase [Motilibacter rhizosphaerae]|uniref:Cellulose synthase/poly-beta-1,6-N-acetylglucosamine synthase-like glycosyltransferase n=1 Tax=Motilibacter rhizosphaerae TaxID=598652 RepID=A0A4Q7NRZ1_9ACTN|nr:glycosyltransferase [Motilibacter rhizosphaerae]RZS89866.1 cellulose synthase/poly-beta-1,6-N-acetylglucosamine synthase-like glycosyltransferase [Motilibacter rhizosphaerae]
MSTSHDLVAHLLALLSTPVLCYFVAINTSYLLLIAVAATDVARTSRRAAFAGHEDALASPMTLPVSVLVPAYEEEAGIVEAVRALTALRYPEHEVVVVDDGSTDGTFEALRSAFDLTPLPRALPDDVPTRGRVRSVHVPSDGTTPLTVVRTTNGGRSSALNTALNAARHPLVCMVDADSILDPDSLLHVTKPFVDDPERVVVTGGSVRAVNGCGVRAGRVVEVAMPRRWIERIQVLEYLRAFMLGRAGWSRLGSLLLVSGAFGVFRRDVLVEVGGLDIDCIGEDLEVVTRIHRFQRDRGGDYRVVFVPEPVSWTEVPSSTKVLRSQRRRWHRGLWEVLSKHRRMMGNPRYGRIGLVAVPYYVVFELCAPVLELVGAVLLPVGLLVGAVNVTYAWRFLLLAYGYAVFVSLAALAIEEFSFHRYPRWRDLLVAAGAAVLENLGYRQLTAWWRLQGLWAALRGKRQVWGQMTRSGFTRPTPLP